MSAPQPLAVNTAPMKDSIWKGLNQAEFRKRVADLKGIAQDNPGEPKAYSQDDWLHRKPPGLDKTHVLPFEVEERLANDLAFIAAINHEADTVSVVALEELSGSEGLIVRLGANGTIKLVIIEAFKAIFETIESCASRRLHRTACRDKLLDFVTRLNRNRLHGRLQSKHWKRPWNRAKSTPPEPLHQCLQEIARHQVENDRSKVLKKSLNELRTSFKHVDACSKDTAEELDSLKRAIQQSYAFCTPNGRPIEETIQHYGFDANKALQNKHIRQINKLGRYWGLCEDLAYCSRRYPKLFESIHLEVIPRYQSYTPPVVQPAARESYYVHAEIQLLTFYGLHPDRIALRPRVLGVSKSACYLCDMFVRYHKHFFLTKTHGRLYHHWNVPDLATFSQKQRHEYRYILTMMDQEIRRALSTEKARRQKRQYPMESYVALPRNFPTSSLPSNAGSLISTDSSQSAIVDGSGTATPLAAIQDPSVSAQPLGLRSQGSDSSHVSVLRPKSQQSSILAITPSGSQKLKSTDNIPSREYHPIERVSPHRQNSPLLSPLAGLQQEVTSVDDIQRNEPESTYSTPSLEIPSQPSITPRNHDSPQSPTTSQEEPAVNLSSSSIASWEYPLERVIIPANPFFSSTGDFTLTVETENLTRGKVRVAKIANDEAIATLGTVIDLQAMAPGEVRMIETETGNAELTFRSKDSEETVQVKLNWL